MSSKEQNREKLFDIISELKKYGKSLSLYFKNSDLKGEIHEIRYYTPYIELNNDLVNAFNSINFHNVFYNLEYDETYGYDHPRQFRNAYNDVKNAISNRLNIDINLFCKGICYPALKPDNRRLVSNAYEDCFFLLEDVEPVLNVKLNRSTSDKNLKVQYGNRISIQNLVNQIINQIPQINSFIQKQYLKQKLYTPSNLPKIKSNDKINQSDFDFIEKAKLQIEIGALAEDIVLKDEKQYLKQKGINNIDQKVLNVSDEYHRGYDILSIDFDKNGNEIEKHIEVKAISTLDDIKSFYLTQNEYDKSKDKSLNYHLYCVVNPKGKYSIIRLKNPDFDNSNVFRKVPQVFKVSFK